MFMGAPLIWGSPGWNGQQAEKARRLTGQQQVCRVQRMDTAWCEGGGYASIEKDSTLIKRAATEDALTEAEAIELAKQGGMEAFEFLYHLHKRRVYSLCLRMTSNTAEAEDLAQEAFLQLFRKVGTFRGESAFSTWLHRLAVNVVLMHLRRKNLPEVPLDESGEPGNEDVPKREIGLPDPALVGSLDRVNLERALETLPPGYRTIFVLHDMEGYEHNEIADMMGCSIGNSKSQLHKARMKLRDLLQVSQGRGAGRA